MQPDPSNTIFQLAVSFVTYTNKNLFITGKAGTGKTTFLKYIKEKAFRKIAVVAPTGVAAINAGGVTIHSLFQIAPGMFIPTVDANPWAGYSKEMNNPATLLRSLKLSQEKTELLRELELLVIDEVSMVRADLLDAMDTILRHIRDKPRLPFGGLQMVFIGDLFQLPPVARNNEWDILKNYYKSPFFFDAHCLRNNQPLFLELKKIYRQKDDRFISLLNNVRNNCCTKEDIDKLHEYYKPGFTPPEDEHFITLSSHNAKADTINQRELEKLPGKLFSFEAEIEGAFYENSYPAEKTLFLKAGAQIMFIKNDTGEDRRYFNGKIGTIKSITPENIIIEFPNESKELELERETWENIRYSYNSEKDQVDEDKQGSFSQYPIRLAWAITIHKSQGLTFDRAIIDAGSSFAAGQVYVSLSRLTTLEGLVLHSRILPSCISTDQRVIDFTNKEVSEHLLDTILEEEQRKFLRQSLVEHFDFSKIIAELKDHHSEYDMRSIEKKSEAITWSLNLMDMTKEVADIGMKFRKQLEHFYADESKVGQVHDRVNAGIQYFKTQIDQKLIPAIHLHQKNIKGGYKIKNYAKAVDELLRLFQRKKLNLEHTLELSHALEQDKSISELFELLERQRKNISLPVIDESNVVQAKTPKASKHSKYSNAPKTPKVEKVSSPRISMKMYVEGKTLPQIAEERTLALSTVISHLTPYIKAGEVDISDLISKEKMDKIRELVNELQVLDRLNPYKEQLGEEFSYNDIRIGLLHCEYEKALAEAEDGGSS